METRINQSTISTFSAKFWVAFIGYSLNLKKLLQMADGATLDNGSDRQQVIEGIVQYLIKYFKMRNYVSSQYKTMSKFKKVLVEKINW
jgi:esterase/lipase